jgi:hypothetical protein
VRTLCALFLTAATPAFAEIEPTEAQREAFIAAVVANGCKMTEDEAPQKLPAVGIDQLTSHEIANGLVDEGLAEISDDNKTLTLKTGGCGP